ncbi:class I SAM-dependent methyltransferase [Paludisphaera borealis]|uniref:Demethylmenaquinone methyltransferase n=1 Tax=Paludisphaera borealis TaxID=1387353 RepID=A0A1U7CVY7_9BACT|nr:class I SAM-dependent methyltransferase [Paludisphaera borealis]APW63095.1 Demethylmenaquinone methyltransferase [Paludisphaera borealis]MDR3618552.1 class I SAM-dependent methyltransferase [Paludisphaera borealis]
MAYDKRQAAEEFARWSESYDRCVLQWLLFGPSHRALIKRIEAVAGRKPISVLDIGCGTGLFASRLQAALPESRVVGLDLVAGMLAMGERRWRYHEETVFPVQGDSERLPFAAGSFDFITCANSFHHYPNQEQAVAEMHRVLKPGGRLLLIDGYRDAPWGWFIYDVCVTYREGNVHHASSRRFREILDRAGFQAVAQKVHRGFAPFLLNEAVAAEPIPAFSGPHFRVRSPSSVAQRSES